MDTGRYDLIVVGAGIAGLTLAVQARRAGLRVACFEQMMFGGLVVNVNHLDPGPGDYEGSGVDLASTLMDEAIDAGVDYVSGAVQAFCSQDDSIAFDCDDTRYVCAALALATGARLRRLGVAGEAELEHRGVSSCADCDAPMFQGQDVAVVGAGDSALQEARVLAAFCGTVHLIVRGDGFDGRADLAHAVRALPNITVHTRTEVVRVLGTEGVEGVSLRDAGSGEVRTLACSGFFAYVGLTPNADWLPDSIDRDAQGFVITGEGLSTSMPGVFALGAARAGFGGLLEHCVQDAHVVAGAVVRRLSGATARG